MDEPEPSSLSSDDDAPSLVCDFVGGAVGHRFRFGGGRGEPLSRAAGFSKGNRPDVVDATAGLGRDAFLLASLGANVTLIERSATVHAMLEEGLARAREADPALAAVVRRMTLLRGDAKAYLPDLRPSVVLVDPMHPPRRGAALVKKEMRVLRDIVGTDPDALALMDVALKSAARRVVLKWPLRADPLPGLRAPTHSILGKTLRFDVFMV